MPNMRLKLIVITLLTSLIFSGCAGGVYGKRTLEGKVLIKGHLPHSFVALKVSARKYYNLVGPLSRLLRASYRGKRIRVSGKVVAKAIGVGMPARFEVSSIDEILSR
jgi:hypothetical protein